MIKLNFNFLEYNQVEISELINKFNSEKKKNEKVFFFFF